MFYDEKLDFSAYSEELERLADQYDNVDLEVVGSSVEGRDIYRIHIHGDGAPVLVTAGHHGNEPAGPMAALNYVREVGENGTALDITLYPLINPDGYEADMRHNAHDVDLNRDYGFFKEPETLALIGSIGREDYIAALDMHEAPMATKGFYVYESTPVREDIHLGQAAVDAVGEKYPISWGVDRRDRPGCFRDFWASRDAYAVTFEPPGTFEIADRIDMELRALHASLDLLEETTTDSSWEAYVPSGDYVVAAP